MASYVPRPPIIEGELIDIHLRRARVKAVSDDGRYLHVDIGGRPQQLLDRTLAGVTVDRVAPAEWPPQPADVWRDRENDAWVACGDGTGGVELCMADGGTRANWRNVNEVAENWGPMRLEFRPGWTPTPPAADVEPAKVDERAAYVARLRTVADFFEQRTDLPVPNDQETLQHTVLGWQEDRRLSDEERFAEIARVAAALGVEVSEDGQTVRYEIAERLIYVVYTYPAPKPKSTEPPMPSDEEIAAEIDDMAGSTAPLVEFATAVVAEAAGPVEAEVICDKCEMPVIQIDGEWQHAEAADAVFHAVVFGAGPAADLVDEQGDLPSVEYERATAAAVVAAATDDRGDAERIADDGLAAVLDRLVDGAIEEPDGLPPAFAVSSRDKDRVNGADVADQVDGLDGVEGEAL